MFYVYLLQSQLDQSYYIGQAEDILLRLNRHNAGLVSSTRKKIPWVLLGREEYSTRSEARWREYQIKHSNSKKKKFIDNLSSPRSLMDKARPSGG